MKGSVGFIPALKREAFSSILRNVIVYETGDDDTDVSTVDPNQLVGIADTDALDSIATEVNERFERVLSAVTDELGSTSEA